MFGMAFITIKIDWLLGAAGARRDPLHLSTRPPIYADRIEPRLYKVRGLEGMNMAIAHEAMSMMRVVLAFGRGPSEWRRWRDQGEEAVAARIDLTVRQTAFQLLVQLITAVGTAAVLGLGAYLAIEGRISPGELTVVLTYIAQVYAPVEQLTQTVTAYQQHFIAFRHAYDLLQAGAGCSREARRENDRSRAGRTRSWRTSTSVTGTRTEARRSRALPSRSIRGESVAVVGPTGAGKSTLASLLPRFYDPQEGRVLIDGEDVGDLTLDSLRAQFSIVLQEPLLFSTSVGDNIKYGAPGRNRRGGQRRRRAPPTSTTSSRSLPKGYRTRLGERGAKLSGGERQRIAVARAFLRDAPILILDEPTSSIDSKTETVILEALDKLMEGRTTILIAHRLSTLRSVTRILVLNEGEVVEQGPHEELMANDGLYAQLWRAQVRDERAVGSGGGHRRRPARTTSRSSSSRAGERAKAKPAHEARPTAQARRRSRPRGRSTDGAGGDSSSAGGSAWGRGCAAAAEGGPARDADQDPGCRARLAGRPIRDRVRATGLRGLLRRSTRADAAHAMRRRATTGLPTPPRTSQGSPSASASATAGPSRRCTRTGAATG